MAGAVQSIASALAVHHQRQKEDAVLIDLANGSDKQLRDRAFKLQYFPDTVSDTKTVNYTPKDVPGGSLPIYQWVSSGERTIAFTAVFTSDVDPVYIVREGLEESIRSEGTQRDIVDIRSAITWLRRFVLPTYSGESGLGVTPPKKLLLVMPNSGIGLYGGGSSNGPGPLGGNQDSIVCVMTQCDVQLEAFFPSGAPRVASVQLGFAQIPQYNGQVEFPGISAGMEAAVDGNRGVTIGYRLPAKARKV